MALSDSWHIKSRAHECVATAKPFETFTNALSQSMYLSISHELYLKRLIAGGYEKVFTIGRYFRNEGLDRSHHPEFTMLETMTAFENYEYNMDLIEKLKS